tara:strand:- start:1204 stop:1407 length:204 start_codon:yes stop_codon:yes gene_type:complete
MKINNNTAFKQMKETQFYIDMLINKKLRHFEADKIVKALEDLYTADDLKKIKMQFENQKWRSTKEVA